MKFKILRCSQSSCRFSVGLVFRIQQHHIADFMDQTIARNDVGFDKFRIEIHFGIAFPLLDVRYLFLAFGPRIFSVRHGNEIVPRDAAQITSKRGTAFGDMEFQIRVVIRRQRCERGIGGGEHGVALFRVGQPLVHVLILRSIRQGRTQRT